MLNICSANRSWAWPPSHPVRCFGFSCRCMMEVCEGQQEVLRDLNQRLSGFLDHVIHLQEINLNLQEQIMAWKTPLERDWSSQERTVEELRAQVRALMLIWKHTHFSCLAYYHISIYRYIHNIQVINTIRASTNTSIQTLLIYISRVATTWTTHTVHTVYINLYNIQTELYLDNFLKKYKYLLRESSLYSESGYADADADAHLQSCWIYPERCF